MPTTPTKVPALRLDFGTTTDNYVWTYTAANGWHAAAGGSGGGTITGSGSNLRLTYWNGATSITSSANATIDVSGNITATGFYNSSLKELKENISPYINNALDTINKLNIVGFNFKGDETPKVGVLADETDKILSSPSQDKFDIYNAVGLILKAIQELSTSLTQVQKKLETI